MAWLRDLLTARYTSPSGKSFSFRYTDVSKETDLKTSTYTFPSKSGALVQSLGRGGRRFPLDCVFSGEDCMEQADAFEAGLEERGIGELQHPAYGTRKVVPTGSIKRTDSLATGANVSTVTVTFSETITDEIMPDSAINLADTISSDFSDIEESVCSTFADEVAASDASEQIKITSVLQENVTVSYGAMEAVARESLTDTGVSASVTAGGSWQAFQSLKTQSMELSVSVGTGTKAEKQNFAFSLFAIFKMPSVSISRPQKSIEGFVNANASIRLAFRVDPVKENDIKNQFHSTFLSLTAIVSCLANACKNAASETGSGSGAGFKDREEAINAVAQLDSLFDSYTEFSDTYDKMGIFSDVSTVYYNVQKMIADVEHYVLNTAFDLPGKHTVTLSRDRQLLELLTELYGSLDGMDEFIMDNNLNADELEVLPMGREVCYYV